MGHHREILNYPRCQATVKTIEDLKDTDEERNTIITAKNVYTQFKTIKADQSALIQSCDKHQ